MQIEACIEICTLSQHALWAAHDHIFVDRNKGREQEVLQTSHTAYNDLCKYANRQIILPPKFVKSYETFRGLLFQFIHTSRTDADCTKRSMDLQKELDDAFKAMRESAHKSLYVPILTQKLTKLIQGDVRESKPEPGGTAAC